MFHRHMLAKNLIKLLESLRRRKEQQVSFYIYYHYQWQSENH